MTQRKFYFMNYSKLLTLSKKIKTFIDKFASEQADNAFEFHYKTLGSAIRKPLHKKPISYQDPDGKLKYFRTSLINHEVLATVRKCFGILQDLGYLKSFNFEHVPKQDSYIIAVELGEEQGAFDAVVKQSQYFPIEGEKQCLTVALRATIERDYCLDYHRILAESGSTDYSALVAHLTEVLPNLWLKKYQQMTPMDTYVQQMDREFTFMFDVQSHNYEVAYDDFIEDRVVVSWGLSNKSAVKRDGARMAGYLKGVYNWTDKNTDKGHFIGHSLGGGVDENLFPQRTDINRGQSARGKVYRAMEQYCADNAGTFCFSRPIYGDFSTRPFVLEYGVLTHDGALWVEHFDNV